MTRLAIALFRNAHNAGQNFTDGERHNIRQGEEGTTERILLNLAKTIPELHIGAFNRREESRYGADWEWWISDGSNKWFHLVIQAKKLQTPRAHPAGKYKIKHTIRSTGKQQIDLLDLYARNHGAQSLYALYNPAAPGVRYSDHTCCLGAPGDRITAVSADVFLKRFPRTKGQIDDVPLAAIREYAIPWSCLTDGLVPTGPWGGGPNPVTPIQFAQWVTARLNHRALSAFNSNSAAYSMLVNSATLETVAHGREWVLRNYRDYLNEWTRMAGEEIPNQWKNDWMTGFVSQLEFSDDFFAQQRIRIFDRAELPAYVSAILSNEPIPEDVRHPFSDRGAAPKQVLTLVAPPPPDQPTEPSPVEWQNSTHTTWYPHRVTGPPIPQSNRYRGR
ncbi:hypothetical protein HG717_32600 [Rhodococcus erythropolis]|uniref:DUF6615 family protein n=1 Tax=Rhodococcus erythropolis TaxID=1833 RepID=UPI001C9A6F8D|nr:DUF6615 family protein [Rhodococcus erythropolis]MBY6388619.1 hypothetical protein [Rhodococcus erythropolis]